MNLEIVEADYLALTCDKWVTLSHVDMRVHTQKNHQSVSYSQMQYCRSPKANSLIAPLPRRNECDAKVNTVGAISSDAPR